MTNKIEPISSEFSDELDKYIKMVEWVNNLIQESSHLGIPKQ